MKWGHLKVDSARPSTAIVRAPADYFRSLGCNIDCAIAQLHTRAQSTVSLLMNDSCSHAKTIE